MKTILVVAAAVLSLGIGSAYAGDGGTVANTWFTELPGVVAQAPVQSAPSVATAHNDPATHAYVGNSNRGTQLIAPNGNQSNNS
jgi:hypothetical protein